MTTESEIHLIEDTELLQLIAPYVTKQIRLWQRGGMEPDSEMRELHRFLLAQGLAVHQPYVPAVHGECPYGATQEGDPWIVLTPIALYLLSRFTF
jgi:hypothetical protein